MSATLSINKEIDGPDWKITVTVTAGDTPPDIFLYGNTGTGLGSYIGVCSLNDYKRIRTHVPDTETPVFGNKFLKFTQGIARVPLSENVQATIDKIVADVRAFRIAYLAAPGSTQVVVIT